MSANTITQDVMTCFHIWVWGDRRQNAGSLDFDPTGWTRAISFFLHVYFHPLYELTIRSVTQSYDHYNNTFNCRGPIKASYRYRADTINLRFFFLFFLQICELKRIDLLPRWTKSKDPYVYNGSWNWHRNGWIENKYLSEYQLSIFIAGNLKLLLLQLFLSTV